MKYNSCEKLQNKVYTSFSGKKKDFVHAGSVLNVKDWIYIEHI